MKRRSDLHMELSGARRNVRSHMELSGARRNVRSRILRARSEPLPSRGSMVVENLEYLRAERDLALLAASLAAFPTGEVVVEARGCGQFELVSVLVSHVDERLPNIRVTFHPIHPTNSYLKI